MCFFSVIPYTGSYRTTAHEFKLVFLLKTKVSLSESSLIPTYGLSLVSTDEVCKHSAESDFLTDIIGLLTAVSAEREYVRDGKMTKMIVMELTDDRGRVECALFGDYAAELTNFLSSGTGELPIVIVQFAKIKIFKGNPVIQNVMQTSRILFNAAVPEVVDFRNSLALHGVEFDQPMGVIGDGSTTSKEEEFLKLHPKKTIRQLQQTKEDGIFVVYARVLGLGEGLEWWYPACRCHRAVTPDCGLYYCGGCYKHVIQVVPRFKLSVDVDDKSDMAVFMLFDNDVQLLTKKSCVELVSNLGPLGGYPKELEVIIGKELLFKVKKKTDLASIFGVSYCVKKVCDDESLINVFLNEGHRFTPEKHVFKTPFPLVVNLDDEEDPVDSSQTSEFISTIIISPPSASANEGSCSQALVRGPVKRKLVDVFDDIDDVDFDMPLKEVKIEKE